MDQFGAFLPLILIFFVFWILLIRPQQRKMKEHRLMVENLTRGDKIITSGGLIGRIVKINEKKEITIELNDNIEVQLAAGMVSEKISPSVTTNNTSIQNNTSNKSFLSSLFGNKDKK